MAADAAAHWSLADLLWLETEVRRGATRGGLAPAVRALRRRAADEAWCPDPRR
jgi:hypothetical protein